jgi:hypothetical protein
VARARSAASVRNGGEPARILCCPWRGRCERDACKRLNREGRKPLPGGRSDQLAVAVMSRLGAVGAERRGWLVRGLPCFVNRGLRPGEERHE